MNPPDRKRLIYSRLPFVGLGALAVLLLFPVATQLWDLGNRKAELDALLGNQENLALRQTSLQDQIEKMDETLRAQEARIITRGDSHSLQDKLVGLVRKSGCQLRNINVANIASRRWYDQDDPLALTAPVNAAPSRYDLLTQMVNISVVGSIANIEQCLQSIQADEHFKHTARLTLSRDDADDSLVFMEIELLFFGFEQVAVESLDMDT